MGLWIDSEGGLHALVLMTKPCSGGSTLWVLLGFLSSNMALSCTYNKCQIAAGGAHMINQGMDTFPSYPLFFLSPIVDRGTRAIGV